MLSVLRHYSLPQNILYFFNGSLFDLITTLNHSVSLVCVFFDLLIVLPFFITSSDILFFHFSNLSFN